MKFDLKYPKADVWEEPRMCLIKGDRNKDCFMCMQPTVWFELNYQAPVCSDECLEALESEYNRE